MTIGVRGMEWNEDAVHAARNAIKAVGDAVDNISIKAVQLEALLVTLMHAARSADDLPSGYLESVCWLASDLAADIKKSADKLG